jgi:hypothetical protein
MRCKHSGLAQTDRHEAGSRLDNALNPVLDPPFLERNENHPTAWNLVASKCITQLGDAAVAPPWNPIEGAIHE